MTRTHPPRGRFVSLLLFAAVIMSSLLAAPAVAAGDLAVSVSPTVTGRDALRVTPEGLAAPVPLVVEITDASGRVGTWRYPADLVANDATLSVDLSSPDSGATPRNGRAGVTVSGPAGAVAAAQTTIDRAPPAAVLHSIVRAHRVGLTWSAVSAPDEVTYKLERIATGGAWTVVQSTTSAAGFTDRELEPGRYRYRLTAGVPSADGGTNWARPTAVQVRIVAPIPTPSPTATQDEPAAPLTEKPAAKKPAAKKPAAKKAATRKAAGKKPAAKKSGAAKPAAKKAGRKGAKR